MVVRVERRGKEKTCQALKRVKKKKSFCFVVILYKMRIGPAALQTLKG